MSVKFMRMILYFDLPVLTKLDRRNYRKFRTLILSEGFIMQQESVYSKLLLNSTNVKLMKDKLVLAAPPKGLIELLVITEKQYHSIDMIVGSRANEYIDNIERLIIL